MVSSVVKMFHFLQSNFRPAELNYLTHSIWFHKVEGRMKINASFRLPQRGGDKRTLIKELKVQCRYDGVRIQYFFLGLLEAHSQFSSQWYCGISWLFCSSRCSTGEIRKVSS